jgi:predicted nucleic acid-binding protein
MKTVTFDTYAWVEYFSGTRKGELARDYVESPCVILTPAIALFELSRKYLREGKPQEKAVAFVCQRSKVVPFDSELALVASRIAVERKLAAADAAVYATGIANSSVILTGDDHLQGLDCVEFLK